MEEQEFGVYRFYAYVCVAAANVEHAKQLLIAQGYKVEAELKPKRLMDEDSGSFEANPEHFVYPDALEAIFVHYYLSSKIANALKVNEMMIAVKHALSKPSTFPRVPELELANNELIEFCWNLIVHNEYDKDVKTYYFIRYPQLSGVLISFREKWEENHFLDVADNGEGKDEDDLDNEDDSD